MPKTAPLYVLTVVDVLVNQVVGVDFILRDSKDPADVAGRDLHDRGNSRDVVGAGTVKRSVEAFQIEEAVTFAPEFDTTRAAPVFELF